MAGFWGKLLEIHLFQKGEIVGTPFTYIELIGLPFRSGDQGELDSIKVLSLASSEPMKGLSPTNARACNADIMTNANGRSVDEEISAKLCFGACWL